MNILWITKLTDETCHKTSEFEMSEELRKKGHNVTIIMAKKIGEKKSINNKIIYLPTFELTFISGFIFGLVIFFYSPIVSLKKKIDMVIIDAATVWIPFTLTLKLCQFPLILDIRTLPIDREKSIGFDITLHLSKYAVDGLTMITPELEEILKKKYNLKNKKIGNWASGVSLKKFAPVSTINEKIKFLRNLNFFILMYHGAYSTTRGIENLIKSLERLDIDLRKKIMLIIIGFSQDEEKYLTYLCEKLSVQNQVKFFPKVKYDEIPSYISMSDVGVYPLPPDNIWWHVSAPLKTLEYLAMGKPVIVTNIPFHKRIFEKGECGIILDTNTPQALANAIRYLFENKEKLVIMGKNGKEIVEKYHSWELEASNLERFLWSIIERK
jgi:glycosyltransferase involved in cell wall biosynthesis